MRIAFENLVPVINVSIAAEWFCSISKKKTFMKRIVAGPGNTKYVSSDSIRMLRGEFRLITPRLDMIRGYERDERFDNRLAEASFVFAFVLLAVVKNIGTLSKHHTN
jgi:hypothetical protein